MNDDELRQRWSDLMQQRASLAEQAESGVEQIVSMEQEFRADIVQMTALVEASGDDDVDLSKLPPVDEQVTERLRSLDEQLRLERELFELYLRPGYLSETLAGDLRSRLGAARQYVEILMTTVRLVVLRDLMAKKGWLS